MLPRAESYEAATAAFSWEIPARYNIGVDVCDRWALGEPDRLAMVALDRTDGPVDVTYGELRALSNQLANALAARGVGRKVDAKGALVGDRVGVLLPQRLETAVAHIAALKLGAISIPLFTLFGPEALAYRLRDAAASAVITDAAGAKLIAELRAELPALQHVLSVDGGGDDVEDYSAAISGESDLFEPVDTAADDPAILIYTSGTTGGPKGALHAHRVLPGHLPGVEMSHNFLPQAGDRIWTPADWAWIGGLLDVLMPALHHGVPVVAKRFAKFDAEAAFALLRDQRVTCSFLPPTALKMMRSEPEPERFGLAMRSVASGGESLGEELISWGIRAFGVTINEFYGQTECNMVVSSCARIMDARPGFMGRAVPGHQVAVLDPETGARVPTGEEGAIGVKAPDPVMFIGYWNNPEATAEKFVDGPDGRWLLTGDQGVEDESGWLRFVGREDDVISSAAYRIGPGEIEDCLLRHPAVALAGVVGKPDALRGTVVAAYLVLKDGFAPSEELAAEIGRFVKERLAAYEYPRVVRFLDALPMTTTGKIIRRELRDLAHQEADAEAEAAKDEKGAGS